MRNILISVLTVMIIIGYASCGHDKSMTTEELKKSTAWKNLGKGVDYISIKESDKILDSIRYNLKSIAHANPLLLKFFDSSIQAVFKPLLAEFTDKIPQSQRGYLRVDFAQMPQDTSQYSKLPSFPLIKPEEKKDNIDYIEYKRY